MPETEREFPAGTDIHENYDRLQAERINLEQKRETLMTNIEAGSQSDANEEQLRLAEERLQEIDQQLGPYLDSKDVQRGKS